MRTTIELPPDLMRRAKSRAAARGESLKELFTRAIASEIGASHRGAETSNRMRLPLFGDPDGPPVSISNEDIARLLAQEDAESAARFNRKRGK
jgi:hypothetical protein